MLVRRNFSDIAKDSKEDRSKEKIMQNIFKSLDIKSLSRMVATSHDMQTAVEQHHFREHERNLHESFPEAMRHDFFKLKVLPGGLTNSSISFKMSDENAYVSRKVGAGSSLYINRLNEKKNAAIISKIGVGPRIIWHDDNGDQVVEFIKNARPMKIKLLKDDGNLDKCTLLMKKMHESNEHFDNVIDLFGFCRMVREKIEMSSAAREVKEYVDEFRALEIRFAPLAELLKQLKLPTVACHFDPNPGNFIDSNGVMKLIDVEYSVEAPAHWDLSDFSMEAALDERQYNRMLHVYYDGKVSERDRHVVTVLKPVVEYFWSVWAIWQVVSKNQLDKLDELKVHMNRLQICKSLLAGEEYAQAVLGLEKCVEQGVNLRMSY